MSAPTPRSTRPTERPDAPSLIDAVLDPGTWQSWDPPGEPESVLTGSGTVGGRRAVLVVSEFGFSGGSIGAAAGGRIVVAIRRATDDGLPVLALPASGGTRMQEGTPAFLQMAAITAAVNEHRAAGLPYLVYLRHPTTGGVFASWGSLGDVGWAQPGALTGFLGPKVYQGIYREPFPAGVQNSDNLHRLGFIDDVFPPVELGARFGRVLAALDATSEVTRSAVAGPLASPVDDAWAAVEATRRDDRPGLVELTAHLGAVPLAGAGPVRVGLARLGGRPTILVGQDRRVQADGELISADALRVARRAVALATRWRLPLVTVVDTSGGELSVAAEESGLARQIAHCTAELLAAPVPTASVLLGQGTGGAALAMFPADLRVAATDAWLSPLPPEGASIIMHGDTEHAPQMAREQQIWARELSEAGLVDVLADTLDDVVAALDAWAAADQAPDLGGRIRVGR
ncbi:carboxyl transferase domain-containing protein [Gordonia sp. (in: high G+C Gram-positive bacteria)]|uniref:carboxyl transferase domain-containing protein n=1 Tax=Gordonia sp. (in: high G+C Gram-positive bacteria) TaxID=84139 RepID=UPI00168E8E9C|nr:carboxyl transferase domain-containing protein [Gordonia sp. (in: high G+C Gram-positive bacteria)]NLG48045.1 carboxyl transferase [Gordonia sp. (in: high G+C Gram-positive bacteria)]